jgi:hypothetical protein
MSLDPTILGIESYQGSLLTMDSPGGLAFTPQKCLGSL